MTSEIPIIMSFRIQTVLSELWETVKGTALLDKVSLLMSMGFHFKLGLFLINVDLAERM